MSLTVGAGVEDVETLVGEEGETAEAPGHEEEKEAQDDTGTKDEPGEDARNSVNMGHNVSLAVRAVYLNWDGAIDRSTGGDEHGRRSGRLLHVDGMRWIRGARLLPTHQSVRRSIVACFGLHHIYQLLFAVVRIQMKIHVAAGSKGFDLEVVEGEDAVTTLGDLKIAICDKANLDAERMKIIHRGKTLSGPDAALLEKMQFQENDKLLVMGKKKAALKDDPGFAALVKYEKDFLTKLQKTHEDVSSDLTELEKNFLDKVKSQEMAKNIDKRLKMFAENALRHLESIDALVINSDDTPAEQATRNREKRKALINGVQTLLNQSDKDVRRLEEYTKKLSGEIIE